MYRYTRRLVSAYLLLRTMYLVGTQLTLKRAYYRLSGFGKVQIEQHTRPLIGHTLNHYRICMTAINSTRMAPSVWLHCDIVHIYSKLRHICLMYVLPVCMRLTYLCSLNLIPLPGPNSPDLEVLLHVILLNASRPGHASATCQSHFITPGMVICQ
jgi:hypothetical protein